jgi:hypothetical protein
MENLSLESILIIAVFAGMVLFVATWYYQEARLSKSISERAYEMQYKAIQGYIDHWPVTPESYNAILAELKRLGNMKYKNREKTEVLTTQFLRKYTESDEFSFEQLNVKETSKRLQIVKETREIEQEVAV